MIAYIIRRVLISVSVLFAVATLIFLAIRLAPGDPVTSALGDYASKETVQAFREKMGLNDPLHVQYGRYIYGLLRGDLGKSLISGMPVASQVAWVLPYSLELAAVGVMIGSAFGVLIGIWTALRRNTIIDYIVRVVSLAGVSLPIFFTSILLMLLFSIKLDLFPAIGGGDLSDFRDNFKHLALPALALALLMTAYTARMARSSVLNVLGQDYVRTARAKGLPRRIVIFKHALRNALIPVLAVVGVYTIVAIGSSVMVEVVFARPGLGRLMVGALRTRDYFVLQSVMVIYGSFVVIINLVTDLLYGFLDPRITYR